MKFFLVNIFILCSCVNFNKKEVSPQGDFTYLLSQEYKISMDAISSLEEEIIFLYESLHTKGFDRSHKLFMLKEDAVKSSSTLEEFHYVYSNMLVAHIDYLRKLNFAVNKLHTP